MEVNKGIPPAYNGAGGVFMCRKNWLLGCSLAAFGLGMFVASFFESGFVSGLLGVAITVAGVLVLRKK